jgi:deoxyribonuclease-4
VNQVGLHIRITDSLHTLAEKALRLELPFFQCFFSIQNKMSLLRPTGREVLDFLRLRRAHFTQLYAHGSYWINLASIERRGHYALDRELTLARRLEFTHFVLHPGSAKGAQKKEEGIDAVVRSLNAALHKHPDITLVLENAAHGGMTVGGDIADLAQIYTQLDKPERVALCIDTAHAHVYGYDIITAEGRHNFISLIDATIGLSSLVLLHVNDTHDARGSKLDRHQLLGTGILGVPALQAFVTDQRLRHIPVLTEPPVVTEEIEREQLTLIRSWYAQSSH